MLSNITPANQALKPTLNLNTNTWAELSIPSARNPDFHSPYSTVSAIIDQAITPAIPKPTNPGLAMNANNQKFS